MKIIILGSGQVGGTLAEHLRVEGNDITVVDIDAERLGEIQSRLDIRTVLGPASHPSVLAQAGADNADMLIAVTSDDETNMVACQIAFSVFQTPTKIARIRSTDYLDHKELFVDEAFPIDVCISPEQLVTNDVRRLIEHPGALQVLDFADGKVQLVAIRPQSRGHLVGKTLAEMNEDLGEMRPHIAAIFRGHHSITISDSTVIKARDEILFIAASPHILDIMQGFGCAENPHKKIIIAGGGNIGYHLAASLEEQYQIKIIEHNPERSKFLAKNLNHSTILLGDAADKALLVDENIEHTDVFCAVTNDDEANIMAALQAKRLGAHHVMALITRTAYVELIEGGDIDIAISPQQATIGSILTHMRRGDIVNVHSLRRGAAEAIEVIAHGDEKTSKVIGKEISKIKFPKGATIGAIVRDSKTLIADKEIVIQADDHVIIFLQDKKHIHEVERLFQVDITYI